MEGELVHEPTNSLTLIARAIEKGLDPDALSKLYDLHERSEQIKSVMAYNAAMQACQAEMQPIVCDSHNPQTKSRYASVESILRKIKPVYTRHGFALSFGEDAAPVATHCRTTCECMHTGGHSKHYHLDLPLDGIGIKGNANMTAIHGRLSSDTYAQSRLLRKIFNLTISEDDTDMDGNIVVYISDEQVKMIEGLLVETKADREKFLAWVVAGSVAEIRLADFAKARNELLYKKKQMGGK